MPVAPLIDLLNSIICGFCGYHLYRSWRIDQRQLVLLYFSQGYFVLIFSYLFFSLPYLFFPDSAFLLGVSFIISQSLLYLAVAFFAKVTAFFIRVQWAQRVFWSVVLVAVMAVLLHIVFFSYPVYDKAIGITDWNIHPVVGIFSVIILAGVLVPSAVFFFQQGIKSREKVVRTRSLIISTGLLFLIITAYTYYSATTYLAVLISDLFSLLSFLIIYFGVIYKRVPGYKISLNNRL